jgi:hypothetical protein
MASSINPNNIDGTYPVAGQDNDSQGFRDNFTNIKTNFTSAKSEIEALQTTSVSLTAENDFNFTGIISKAIMKNNADSVNALGTVGGAIALDSTTGIIHSATLNAVSTLSFTNLPASGKGGRVRFIVTITDVAHTLTLPAAVTLGNETVQGMSSNVITFPTVGTYAYDFSTIDGGLVILVEDLTQSDTELGNLQISGNTISAYNTNGDIVLSPNGTGAVKTDNLQLDGNTVSSTDANGNIVLSPNGTGEISVAGTTAIINTAATDQSLTISPNGTGVVDVPAGYKDRAGFGTNSLASKEYVDLTVSSGTIANVPLSADGGTSETIINGDTLTLSGGTNITTASSASDTITFNLDATVTGLTSLQSDTLELSTGGTPTIQTPAASNANLLIAPDGTGVVNIGGTAPTIGTPSGNLDLIVDPNGTGSIDLRGEIIIDSAIVTTPASNANIELAPDGTGTVKLSGNGTSISISTDTNEDLVIAPNGTGTIDFDGGIATATSATAGANGDVPAQVEGYLIVKIGGTGYKIPYYAT